MDKRTLLLDKREVSRRITEQHPMGILSILVYTSVFSLGITSDVKYRGIYFCENTQKWVTFSIFIKVGSRVEKLLFQNNLN